MEDPFWLTLPWKIALTPVAVVAMAPKFILLSEPSSDPKTDICNCLPDISTGRSQTQLKFNMSNLINIHLLHPLPQTTFFLSEGNTFPSSCTDQESGSNLEFFPLPHNPTPHPVIYLLLRLSVLSPKYLLNPFLSPLPPTLFKPLSSRS